MTCSTGCTAAGPRAADRSSPRADPGVATVGTVLLDFSRDPTRTLLLRWNWKSALLSSLLRAGIFFVVNLGAGWHAALGAMLAELALRGVTSGFYGAITEAFSFAQPAWQATAVTMAGMPILNHSLEFLVHWLRHTPKLRNSIIASMAFTSVSTAFNLYAMRRGHLTVGGESKSLQHDLIHVPALLLDFICAGPRWLIAAVTARIFPR